MADRLGDGLARAGLASVWPVEGNEVFVILPRPTSERLKSKGASFYPWTTDSLPAGVVPGREAVLVRLVTSFATTAGEVDEFVAMAG
jgi:threonine aldolase